MLCVMQLVTHGYGIMPNPPYSTVSDAADVLMQWFQQPTATKQQQTGSTDQDIRAPGPGFFILPDKEMLEAYRDLQQAAIELLQSLFRESATTGLHATEQQVQDWQTQQNQLQQPAGGMQDSASSASSQSSSSSSVLHISSGKQSSPSRASSSCTPLLGGSEPHVDRGLLTVIYTTQPGLQVLSRDGVWVPISHSGNQLVALVGHTLSWATAGRLPAAHHRIVLDDNSTTSSSTPRLSLAFKLRAAPEALFNPASITGQPNSSLLERYRTPKRTLELMQAFDASHASIHNPALWPQEQQQQQQKRPRLDPGVKTEPFEAICIIIKNQQGIEVHIKVERNIPMAKVFATYEERRCITGITGMRYMYKGWRVHDDVTPALLGMQDMDVVDAYLVQCGD